MTPRERRELAFFRANRKGRGKPRVAIDRTPLVRPTDGDVRFHLHGAGIVVRPRTYTRDKRKAFAHYCESHGITLVPVETVSCAPPGIGREVVRTSAYLAVGSPDALKALTGHDYVSGDWDYATTMRAPGSAVSLARKPAPKQKDETSNAWAEVNNAYLAALAAGELERAAEYLALLSTATQRVR